MEKELVACALGSRTDYELIQRYIHSKSDTYSKEFQVILARIEDYYSRDPSATSVSPTVLQAQIVSAIRSEKLAARLSEFMSSAVSSSFSPPNVRDVVLAAQRQVAADKLSAALVSGE